MRIGWESVKEAASRMTASFVRQSSNHSDFIYPGLRSGRGFR